MDESEETTPDIVPTASPAATEVSPRHPPHGDVERTADQEGRARFAEAREAIRRNPPDDSYRQEADIWLGDGWID